MHAERLDRSDAVRDPAAELWLCAAQALLRDPNDPAIRAWLAGDPPLPTAPWPAAPAELIARPTPLAPAAYHAGRLRDPAQDPLEIAWHARWLAYALAPNDPASWPKVSVVIPVFNRRVMVVEAVESVLSQDWPATEVIVIDDASDDDPRSALAPYLDRIVFRRLEQNGGVSVARNAGLTLATGELVQFLDSDNLLPPGTLSRKVAALAHVPDALLCFNGFDSERTRRRGSVPDSPPLGSAICPTQDPRVGLIIAYSFLTSTVMAARHALRRAGNFDERLRRCEDLLLFKQLGLQPVKTIALDAPLMIWRRGEHSLFEPPDDAGMGGLAGLIFINELLPSPRQWDLAALAFRQCFADDQWAVVNRSPSAAVLEERDRLCAWLEGLGQGRHLPALSPRPLAAELLAVIERDGGDVDGPVARPVQAALQSLLAARPPGAADLALWRQSHNPAINRAAFREIFASLSAALRDGRCWVPLATLDQRPFRSLPHPRRRRWKRIAQVARLFGERPARALARWRG
jgi:hypothetical protein